MRTLPLTIATVLVLSASFASAVEFVTLQKDGRETHVTGKALVEDQQGGLLLLDQDGALWLASAEEITRRKQDAAPFEPLAAKPLAAKLLKELPPGFSVYQTSHFVICYNGSRAFAQWCGGIYEKFYKGFHAWWRHYGIELQEPQFPLVAIVFKDRASFEQYAKPRLGNFSPQILGFYDLQSNRILMYDLTGVGSLQQRGVSPTQPGQVARLMMQPKAEPMVATLIHEVSHQLAYNCGLHQRLADIPFWVNEGLAVYFESPDLSSGDGWRTIGAKNTLRLRQFRDYLPRRGENSLRSLLSDSTRFRDPTTAEDAYGEAWAFTYFLVNQKSDKFREYLQSLMEKPPVEEDTPEARVQEFVRIFGADLNALDAEFLRFMRSKAF